MKHSLVIPPPPGTVDGLARAYVRRNDGWRDISYSPLNFMVGHDGVVSTPGDMEIWARHLGKMTSSSSGASSPAFKSGSTNDGRPTNYSAGWRHAEINRTKVLQHEGCWSGYRNAIVHVPDARLSAVVLSNAADGKEFWNCEDNVQLARELIRRSLANEVATSANMVR
jgi:CubicO group peptidase (beta-lactamase class C family)